MIEHDKQSARSLEPSVQVEPENVQDSARRRFVKGLGIGLPAVMTLRSGALMAATSSQCLLHPPAETPHVFAKGDTVWLRGNTAYDLCEKSGDGTVIKLHTSPIACSDTNCYDEVTGASGVNCDSYTGQVGVGQDYYPLCHVHVNQEGQLINTTPNPDCGPNAQGGNLATNSCALDSFNIITG